jgi:hypothetical protein
MKPAPTARADPWDVVAQWIWRGLIALALLPTLAASLVGMKHTPTISICVALASTYALVGLLAPKRFVSVHRNAGRALQGAYRMFAKPFVLRPLSFVARAIDAVIVSVGRFVEGLFMLALKLGLWVLGIAVLVALGAIAIAGVAALPVSLAVIVGALIVGAMARRT